MIKNEEQGVGLELLKDRRFIEDFERFCRETRAEVRCWVLRFVLLNQCRIPCANKGPTKKVSSKQQQTARTQVMSLYSVALVCRVTTQVRSGHVVTSLNQSIVRCLVGFGFDCNFVG